MIRFTTIIKKFDKQGEKTGWTYILLSSALAQQLKPGCKKSFRIKGKLDSYSIEKAALLPMGEGNFILPLNASIRKAIKKQKGAPLEVCIEADEEPLQMNKDLMECLQDEPLALKTFNALAKGHQVYFSKWIETAKTAPTKAKRIAMAVNAWQRVGAFPRC
ncbi:MAG: YdeI/OmpD-associated family protein [Bacteroidota bacterium]|nr:YdeI/OmpD-associated family protein [Bacteroidota bacterium]